MQKFLKKPGYQYLLMFASFLVFSCYSALATEYYVTTSSEITSAMNGAQPGDTLTMANGVWTDAHIVFEGNGTEDQPILLRSESPGCVILSGSSNLRIAGDYLIVDGLYFKNGYSSSGGVIEFRNGSSNLSNHCRLTNTAIENYNPADANINYKWVSLYGSHNRVDHCYFKGKNHRGTTLVVWFKRTSDPPAHYHLIDHNYFAHRPKLGQNGGETIRIGTSNYSMSDSYTIVEHNYFEYCNGELEIISNKSCENIYRYNTFYECEGVLTLRHGNRCTVHGNFFIGNRKSNTGGVRVIGEEHKIYNNYFCGLYGSSFKSALPVLNGVPNSPLNRYFQVKNALIVFNTFFDCKYTMIIGAGADDERTLPPEDCIIANNLVKTNYQVIGQKAEPINMTWEGNIMQGSSLGIPQPEGITIIDPQLVLAEDGLWRPAEFSPAIGTATGDYDFVIDDMDGQPRDDGEKDIGGDEFSDVPIVNRSLTRNDVRFDWINSPDLPVDLFITKKGSGSGNVMLNPAGGFYDVGTVVTLTALPDINCTFNGWGGDLTGTANPDTIIMDSNKMVTATFAAPPDPLSEALDTALSFTAGGSEDWFGQTATSYYGGDAAQSGNIGEEQDSWMQTTVSGTGTVSFYWKVSSEDNFDFLEFYIDGSLQDQISGSVDWQQKTYTIITSGSHTLEWRYVKDGNGDSGSDCAWVDKLEWVTN